MAVIEQQLTERYAIYHSDVMEVLPDLSAESVGLSVYSPPFPETYVYSNDPRDLANCATYEEGLEHYGFVVGEVHRLTKPGRLTAVHCMDLKDGSFFQKDFPGDIVRLHKAAGFRFFCRVTIWQDPWLIARRTRMKSLRHKNLVEDSSTVRVGPPQYVLVFKKPGKNPEPICHPAGLKEYAGATPIPGDLLERFSDFRGDQKKNKLSHWIFRNYASPVWMDIRLGRLLPFADSKENPEEQHVCPLSLDCIERCLTLWSNPGDVVLTPFMGIGSEVYMAVLMGRKGLGTELKASYFRQAKLNVQAALTTDRQGEAPLLDGIAPLAAEQPEEDPC